MAKPSWQVLEAHAAALHALLLRLTLRRDVADELLHELFVKVATKLDVDAPGAYLRRSAINIAMDWRRSEGRMRTRMVEPPGGLDPADSAARSPTERVENADEVARVLDAAARLPELSRQAFVLRFVQAESYEAIGATLGRTAHQARGLCHAAVTDIRRKLAVSGAKAGDPCPTTK